MSVRSQVGKLWTAILVLKQRAVQHGKRVTGRIIYQITCCMRKGFEDRSNVRKRKKKKFDEGEVISDLCKIAQGSVCLSLFLSFISSRCILCGSWKCVTILIYSFHPYLLFVSVTKVKMPMVVLLTFQPKHIPWRNHTCHSVISKCLWKMRNDTKHELEHWFKLLETDGYKRMAVFWWEDPTFPLLNCHICVVKLRLILLLMESNQTHKAMQFRGEEN